MHNCYADFAAYYDRLIWQDINYEQWADYIENLFAQYGLNPDLVCDLACGTGNITLPLARRGSDMIGVDRSAEMLAAAREKPGGERILFLNQDMTHLDLYGTADAFLCMIDGFNYVLQPQALLRMLRRIKSCFLNPGGILIFDVSSQYKLSTILGNNTFIYDTDAIFYTWENRYIQSKHLCDMELNFFIKEHGRYKRFRERHLQRAYSAAELAGLLRKAGFSKIETFGELSFAPPAENSSRIVFTAR